MNSISVVNDRIKIYDDLYLEIVTSWDSNYALGSGMSIPADTILTSKIYLRTTSTNSYSNLDVSLKMIFSTAEVESFDVSKNVELIRGNSAVLLYEVPPTKNTLNPFYRSSSDREECTFTIIDYPNDTKFIFESWHGYGGGVYGNTFNSSWRFSYTNTITEAHDFTDEENLTIKHTIDYNNNANKVGIFNPNDDDLLISKSYTADGNKTTTFTFTDAQRETLRNTFNTAVINKIRIGARTEAVGKGQVTKTVYNPINSSKSQQSLVYTPDRYFLNYIEKNLTIVKCTPSVNPTVKDIKPETLALTGSENVIVRYESMAEYSIGAVASKGAEIVSQSVQCGSKKVEDMSVGIIDDTESGTFIFNATDSRGLRADPVIIHKTLVEYVKPTCYQDFEVKLSSKTSAEITIKISGNYYQGSFGLVDNTFLLEMRYGKKGEELSEWAPVANTPTFSGDEYETTLIFDGIHYEDSYTFQCRVTDKLNYVQTSQYTVKMLPVFDWSESDFNFNVPVMMNGETVLRHNEEAGNTVLSASGGHIYLRPAGTDETTGETIIYPDGSIKFGGAVDLSEINSEVTFNKAATFNNTAQFNYSFLIGDHILNDFVIETGSEAMGTNGTWYWTKWASGKAECYGRRNFGRVAMTTSTTNGYRSAEFTQDLPADLFIEAPDVISMSACPNGASGFDYVWVVPSATTPSDAGSTGSFHLVRLASATSTASDISFNIIGRWK